MSNGYLFIFGQQLAEENEMAGLWHVAMWDEGQSKKSMPQGDISCLLFDDPPKKRFVFGWRIRHYKDDIVDAGESKDVSFSLENIMPYEEVKSREDALKQAKEFIDVLGYLWNCTPEFFDLKWCTPEQGAEVISSERCPSWLHTEKATDEKLRKIIDSESAPEEVKKAALKMLGRNRFKI